ncbi:DinB family protein [Paenibacillus sp. IHBB 10380]|uniref:DinB family protein n=1 Tax=Paenibacillus sp. IHBB 10380 TaxID=1566358 RepID=UPI0006990110|nr:DinB family protein [Paenibacillus sp. IHBB 10380]
MMETIESKEQLLEQFSEWISYVKKLEGYGEDVWNEEIAEGKWSLRELVSHMMLWDKYFFETAIEKIYKEETLTLQHQDFNEFNDKAMEYGKKTSIRQLIDQTIDYREQIIQHIRKLPEESYLASYGAEEPFRLPQYLKDFIWHDQGHMSQLDHFIQRHSH